MAVAQADTSKKRAKRKISPTRKTRENPSLGQAPSDLTVSQVLHYAGSDTAYKILVRSLEFGRVLQPSNVDVVGASSLFRAVLAVGRDVSESQLATSANWAADWVLTTRSPSDVDEWLNKVRLSTPISPDSPLTNSAVAALGRAVAIARRTIQRDQFDARHLVAALFLPNEGRISNSIMSDVQNQFTLHPRDFLKPLVKNIKSSPDPDETPRLAVWDSIANSKFEDPPARLNARQRAFLTDYAADTAVGTDELYIDADVRSIAELICLREAPPPLSIGLFGNWGSGKSFFMHALQKDVAAITARTRAQGDVVAAAGAKTEKTLPPFVANVVQIRFNAWHYADTTLWASLTAEFFEQLRAGGAVNRTANNYGRLVDRVSAHISELRADLAVKQRHAAQLENQFARAELDRNKARSAAAQSTTNLINDTLKGELAKAFSDNREHLRELGRRAYTNDLPSDIDTFISIARDASNLMGRLKLTARMLVAGGPATWLASLAMVLLLMGLTAARRWGVAWLDGLSGVIGVWPAWVAVLPAGFALFRAIRLILGIARSTATFAERLSKTKDDHEKGLAEREAALAVLEKQTENAQQAAEVVRTQLSVYSRDGTTGGQPALLRYMLDYDPDTKEYEKQLGLMSRVRRSFETLDALISTQRDKREQNQPYDVDVPDRIVLYIDDLDRCRSEQVVRVLEAVHLLLAFENIVVVVGVDARWVRAALAKYYQGEFVADVDKNNGNSVRPTTPEDYLEKIFQIPFWLRPFGHGSSDDVYGSFVAALTRRKALGLSAADHETAEPSGKNQDTTKASPAYPDLRATVAPTIATANERVTLKDPEIATLAALAPLAGDTPRAIKRFVNLYRLIRARQRGAEFDKFVGLPDDEPIYPRTAFLLAIETGQPPETIDIVHGLILETQEGTLATALSSARLAAETALKKAEGKKDAERNAVNNTEIASEGQESTAPKAQVAEQVAHINLKGKLAAISKIEKGLARLRESPDLVTQNLPNVRIHQLRDSLHDVRRYSFHHHV